MANDENDPTFTPSRLRRNSRRGRDGTWRWNPGIAVILFFTAVLVGAPLRAQNAPDSVSAESFPVEKLQHRINTLLIDSLPEAYENTRRWGGTREVTTGLRVWRDGLKIKTRRRKSQVNHGTWTRYQVRPITPERHLRLRLTRLAPLEPGRLAVDVEIDARLHIDGRVAQWETGVQVFSVNLTAVADVRMTVRGEFALQLDASNLPPDVVLDAQVKDARLVLRHFRLLALSDVRGAIAHQLGKNLRELLEDEIEDRREKIVHQLNRQITKKKDDLRFSVRELAASKWHLLTQPLPDEGSDESFTSDR